jgi:hypothetical protein
MTKYLLEFHGARATRETLKQSISTGNLELFKLVRERLPEAVLRIRLDLMEVAAQFHREGVFAWLLRDATPVEREHVILFALERKLADALLVTYENGFGAWLYLTRELSLKWRASAKMEFLAAPEGLSTRCGWLRSDSGRESALPPLRSGGGVWTLPRAVERKALISAALPAGVTTIGESAFWGCSKLRRVHIPASAAAIGASAFSSCSALKQLEIPSNVAKIGACAFQSCSGLTQLELPSGVTTIERSAFGGCSSLTRLDIPSGVTTIGQSAFWGCSALTQMKIPSSVTVIGDSAFRGCSGLAHVEIPSSVTTIGEYAIHGCAGSSRPCGGTWAL